MNGTVAALACAIGLSAPAIAQAQHDAKAAAQTQMQTALVAWDLSCNNVSTRRGTCLEAELVVDATYCTGSYWRYRGMRNKDKAARGERRLRRAWIRFSALDAADKKTIARPAAQLRIRLADAAAERLLLNAPPLGLNFDPQDLKTNSASVARFRRWVTGFQRGLAAVTVGYSAAAALKGTGGFDRIAKRRASTLLVALAVQLESMQLPVNVRHGPFSAESSAAFCDALKAQAAPLRQKAKAWKPQRP